MKTIEVLGQMSGALSIRYGAESDAALVEVRPPLFASADGLREMAGAMALAAADLDGRSVASGSPPGERVPARRSASVSESAISPTRALADWRLIDQEAHAVPLERMEMLMPDARCPSTDRRMGPGCGSLAC